MNGFPKISIIIPSFNVVNTIEKCIQSVLVQAYPSIELIIIDGGSTDGTDAIVKKYSDRITYYVSEPDKGVYDAMNKGIKAASGQWYYFLGADDSLYDAGVLGDIFKEGINHTDCDIIYGNIYVPGQDKFVGEEFSERDWLFKNVCHQSVFYRKDLFERLGLYEPQYKVCGDYVFNLKAYHAGVRWKYIDRLIANFSGEGISHYVFDEKFHEDKEKILYWPFRKYPRKIIYDAKKYYIYNEIRHKSIHKGLKELLKRMYYTGEIVSSLKDGSFWLKERLVAGRKM